MTHQYRLVPERERLGYQADAVLIVEDSRAAVAELDQLGLQRGVQRHHQHRALSAAGAEPGECGDLRVRDASQTEAGKCSVGACPS